MVLHNDWNQSAVSTLKQKPTRTRDNPFILSILIYRKSPYLYMFLNIKICPVSGIYIKLHTPIVFLSHVSPEYRKNISRAKKGWEIVKSKIYAWFLQCFSFLFSLSFCPLMNIKRGPSFCASQSAGWVSKCHFLHSVPCLEPNNLSEYETSVTAPKTSLLLRIILFTWLTIDLTVPFLLQFYLQICGQNHFCVTTYSNIYYYH